MGIKRLKTLLHEKCKNKGVYFYDNVTSLVNSIKQEELKESNNISDFIDRLDTQRIIRNQKLPIAIDGNLYSIRYKQSLASIEYGIFRQVIVALLSGLLPIYVFDGFANEMKNPTLIERSNKRLKNMEKLTILLDNDEIDKEEILRLQKKTVKFDSNDLKNIKKFLNIMGVKYYQAEEEADSLLVSLQLKGCINLCQSDDMDLLPKGCKNMVSISSDGAVHYILDEILDTLQLNLEQFVDMCILMGSDYYLGFIPKIKSTELYELFLKKPSLELFVEEYSKHDIRIKSHLEKYIEVRKMFLHFSIDKCDDKLNPTLNFEEIDQYFKQTGLFLDKRQKEYYSSLIQKLNKSNII